MSEIRKVTVSLNAETDDRLKTESSKLGLKKSAYLRALLSKVFSSGGPLL